MSIVKWKLLDNKSIKTLYILNYEKIKINNVKIYNLFLYVYKNKVIEKLFKNFIF